MEGCEYYYATEQPEPESLQSIVAPENVSYMPAMPQAPPTRLEFDHQPLTNLLSAIAFGNNGAGLTPQQSIQLLQSHDSLCKRYAILFASSEEQRVVRLSHLHGVFGNQPLQSLSNPVAALNYYLFYLHIDISTGRITHPGSICRPKEVDSLNLDYRPTLNDVTGLYMHEQSNSAVVLLRLPYEGRPFVHGPLWPQLFQSRHKCSLHVFDPPVVQQANNSFSPNKAAVTDDVKPFYGGDDDDMSENDDYSDDNEVEENTSSFPVQSLVTKASMDTEVNRSTSPSLLSSVGSNATRIGVYSRNFMSVSPSIGRTFFCDDRLIDIHRLVISIKPNSRLYSSYWNAALNDDNASSATQYDLSQHQPSSLHCSALSFFLPPPPQRQQHYQHIYMAESERSKSFDFMLAWIIAKVDRLGLGHFLILDQVWRKDLTSVVVKFTTNIAGRIFQHFSSSDASNLGLEMRHALRGERFQSKIMPYQIACSFKSNALVVAADETYAKLHADIYALPISIIPQ